MDYNEIESKIKYLLKQKGMKMDLLLAKIGISRQGLNYTLRNNTLKIETLEKISIELGVHIGYFFNDEGKIDYGIKGDTGCREELAAAHKKIIELQEKIIGMQEERGRITEQK